MRFIDANILLRYLTRDDPIKAAACFALLQRAQRGEEEITTFEAIIAEVVYVLSARSHYNLRPPEISARLRPVIELRGLRLPQKRSLLRALGLYVSHTFVYLENTIIAARMERQEVTELYSCDGDFDRVRGVIRLEPELPVTQ